MNDGYINFNPDEHDWYVGTDDEKDHRGPRTSVGFNYGRTGGGSRPGGGVSSLAGGSAPRGPFTVTVDHPYSNLGSLRITGDSFGIIADDATVNLSYRYQDIDGGGIATFHLDNNRNPYDGAVDDLGGDLSLPFTGPTPNTLQRESPFTWNSEGIKEGLYYVYGRIMSQSGETRYAYMPTPLYVTASGAEIITKQWTGSVSNNWNDAGNWTGGSPPSHVDRSFIPKGRMVILDSGGTAGDVRVAGRLNWQSGNVSGTLTIGPGAVLEIAGDAARDVRGTLANAGTVNWTGAGQVRGDAAVIENLAGGVFNLRGNATGLANANYPWQVNAFRNAGTLRRDGSGEAWLDHYWPLHNTGTVEVLGGSLGVNRFSQSSGAIILNGGRIAAGSPLQVQGGVLEVVRGSTDADLVLGGSATASFNVSLYLRSLSMSDTSRVSLTPGGGKVLTVSSLSLAPAATLDLNDNALVIRNTSQSIASATHAMVNNLVRNAHHDFAWDQPGITSSTARADVAAGVPSALGILWNNDGGGNPLFYGAGTESPTFMGAAVDANSVIVRFTRPGDGDLNGVVDSVDFGLFQAGYTGAVPFIGFAFGDYDYNGVIDSVDFGLFQAGYNH